ETGLEVSLGIWLRDDLAKNEYQINRGIEVINETPEVIDRVFVGNEVVLRGELTADEVGRYISRVKAAIGDGIPVGTADVWSVWLKHPELARESDFVGIHLLPSWEGLRAEDSMSSIENRRGMVNRKFPEKPVVIAEAGWPSEGRVKKGSVPSPAIEAYFLRHFLNSASAKDYDYYIIEAFDQPWKAEQEGAVGAFWGIYDAEGQPKLSFTGPLSSFEDWPVYAATAAALTLLVGLAVLALLPPVSVRGYVLIAGVIALSMSGALLIVEATSLRYADIGTFGAMLIIVPVGLFAIFLLVSEAVEWALSLWRKKRKALPAANLQNFPRVSIHVPTHDEPPLMVMHTLSALSKLDYPNYEVVVLDNNTGDESLWRPVEAFCKTLGPNFRFFHFDGVVGFKAGALNKALELTDSAAEYIAVVDSDYQVAGHWLRTAMPAFADKNVAVVQAPQDYRDAGESWFKSLCYAEYAGFFQVGMVERNEHNAIIQHGTMCVIRRAALEDVGRWSEWCITEDTELGLRLFEAGYTAVYLPLSMG
ncbi:MAG: glycosyltransferase, partial [Rhodospirillaceae bacterium]